MLSENMRLVYQMNLIYIFEKNEFERKIWL